MVLLVLFVAVLAVIAAALLHWSNKRLTEPESPGFLIALPYQGSANQLTCLVRAAYLARLTNRTLVVPELYPSKHDVDIDEIHRFEKFIDLGYLLRDVRHVSADEFFAKNYVTFCHTYGKWTTFEQLGRPTKAFAERYMIETLEYHQDWPRPPSIKHVLASMTQERIYCIANLQHVHFGNIDSEIANIKFSEDHDNELDVAIHWRRGDFKTVCLNKYPGL